jgi:DNA polymerase III epsilon subunit-like protein
MEEKQDRLYCSIDLEMSGFDPELDEILEIGFVFFTLEQSGLNIVEQWTQVFRPSKPVHPKILGLTGISIDELTDAPLFSEHQEFLQTKLGEATIVGHSVKVDISFLEKAGLILQGKTIDTLELAQFILPTQHSYNLESLIHSFGIEPKGAHRALADSISAALLLEKLLQVYRGFPSSLHDQVLSFLAGSEFSWKHLLSLNLAPISNPQPEHKYLELPKPNELLASSLAPEVIISLPSSSISLAEVAASLHSVKQNILWVVADKATVIEAWQNGFAEPVFKEQDYFDQGKFEYLLTRDDLTPEESRFVLKILVWRATNWQTLSLVDLNISFFGGQFRHLICSEESPSLQDKPLYICDYNVFLHLDHKVLGQRLTVIERPSEFEYAVTKNLAKRASWGFLQYALKAIYNPETSFGEVLLKDQIISLLASADLFFGVVLILTKSLAVDTFITEQDLLEHEYEYQKLRFAGENLIGKLESFIKENPDQNIREFINYLNDFFEDLNSESEKKVKWVEVRDGYCAFVTQPLDIKPIVENLLKLRTSGAVFFDSNISSNVEQYTKLRLGIETYNKVLLPGESQDKISVTLEKTETNLEEFFEKINNFELPMIIAFPNLGMIKEFYRAYYDQLNKRGVIYAQGYSGGTNKIIRNFGIRPQSLLMVTHEFLSQIPLNSVRPKIVVLWGYPEESLYHPYAKALAESVDKLGLDYVSIRSTYTFEELIKKIHNPMLQKLYIFEQGHQNEAFSEFIASYPLFDNQK